MAKKRHRISEKENPTLNEKVFRNLMDSIVEPETNKKQLTEKEIVTIFHLTELKFPQIVIAKLMGRSLKTVHKFVKCRTVKKLVEMWFGGKLQPTTAYGRMFITRAIRHYYNLLDRRAGGFEQRARSHVPVKKGWDRLEEMLIGPGPRE